MKICKHCNIEKELNEFHKSSRQSDGYNYYCKECQRKVNTESYNKHGFKRADKMRETSKKNYSAEKRRIYQYKKYHSDPEYRLRDILRTRFYKAVHKKYKIDSVIILIGCSSKEVREYIEKQWKIGWNWDNYGILWEIDHITPCDSFDLTKLEEQQKCFHYTNLKPIFKTSQIAEQNGYDEIGNRNKYNKIL